MTKYQEMRSKTYNVLQDDGETTEILGDDIFKLPDGKLTTMYHYQKNMELMDEKVNKIDKPKMTEEIKA